MTSVAPSDRSGHGRKSYRQSLMCAGRGPCVARLTPGGALLTRRGREVAAVVLRSVSDLFDATAMYDDDYLYFFAAPPGSTSSRGTARWSLAPVPRPPRSPN